MKLDTVKSVIIAGISLFFGWGVFLLGRGSSGAIPVAVAVTVCCLLFGGVTWCVDFQYARGGMMLKVLAGIWGGCMLALNLILLWQTVAMPAVIIVNGISCFAFLLLANSIYKSKM